MRIQTFNGVKQYESKEMFIDDFELEQRHVDATVNDFTKRHGFRTLLNAYRSRTGLEGYVLLYAHGRRRNLDAWSFADGKRRHRVQDFIDKHDGEALAILLQCCNPQKDEIRAEKSLVIHAKHNMNCLDLIRGGHLRMFIPGVGYLQDRKYALTEALATVRYG